MKNIILFLFLISTTLHAENWLNHSKIKAGSVEAFSIKSECERVSGEICYDMGGLPSSVYSEIEIEVDNEQSPIYSKNEIEICANLDDCDVKLLAKVCSDNQEQPIKNYDLLEVYCSKFLGYNKKLIKSIGIDASKKSDYDAGQVVKATKAAQELYLTSALKKIDCGKRVIATLLVRNASKGLTKPQVKQMNTTYTSVKGLLETGSLESAKDEINAVTPDGTIITEADKIALVSTLDDCK